jgi:hypothetical protein
MSTINVSTGFDYDSQRKNSIRPNITCNVTSMCMALKYSGYTLPLPNPMPDGYTEDDVLENFMLTNEDVSAYYKKIDPNSWSIWQANLDNPKVCTPPNEYHAVLCYGVNLWLGQSVDTFKTNATMQEIIYQFTIGKAVVHSGLWSGFHHIICSVGVITDQDLSVIQSPLDIDLNQVHTIIVDDPYGRYNIAYSNPDGNDVQVSYSDFIKFTNTLGQTNNKVVHIIS